MAPIILNKSLLIIFSIPFIVATTNCTFNSSLPEREGSNFEKPKSSSMEYKVISKKYSNQSPPKQESETSRKLEKEKSEDFNNAQAEYWEAKKKRYQNLMTLDPTNEEYRQEYQHSQRVVNQSKEKTPTFKRQVHHVLRERLHTAFDSSNTSVDDCLTAFQDDWFPQAPAHESSCLWGGTGELTRWLVPRCLSPNDGTAHKRRTWSPTLRWALHGRYSRSHYHTWWIEIGRASCRERV